MTFNVLTAGGAPAGKLLVDEDGLFLRFDYASDTMFPVSRLVLAGRDVFSVGVPTPSGGGLALTKRVSRRCLPTDLDVCRAVLLPAGADPASLLRPAPEPPEPVKEDEGTHIDPGTSEEHQDTPDPCPEAAEQPEPPTGSSGECNISNICNILDTVLPPSEPVDCAPADAAPEEPIPSKELGTSWEPVADPGAYFTDPILRESARGSAGVLGRTDGEDVLLAFPFSPNTPFPMLPAFRLGAAAQVAGEARIVFRVRDGVPV